MSIHTDFAAGATVRCGRISDWCEQDPHPSSTQHPIDVHSTQWFCRWCHGSVRKNFSQSHKESSKQTCFHASQTTDGCNPPCHTNGRIFPGQRSSLKIIKMSPPLPQSLNNKKQTKKQKTTTKRRRRKICRRLAVETWRHCYQRWTISCKSLWNTYK